MSAERDKSGWAEKDLARGYTDEDLEDVSEDEELTPDQIAQARPFAKAHPELAASIRRGRGPQKAPTKVQIAIRLSPEIVDHYRATGPGWHLRMEDALRKAAGL